MTSLVAVPRPTSAGAGPLGHRGEADAGAATEAAEVADAAEDCGKLALSFEVNQGQEDDEVESAGRADLPFS
jgi:hypothetical protein